METYEQYLKTPSLEEILHFYVESGIPILINLREKGNKEGINHSITCIGHAIDATLDKFVAVDFSDEDHEEQQGKNLSTIFIHHHKATFYSHYSQKKSGELFRLSRSALWLNQFQEALRLKSAQEELTLPDCLTA